MAAKKFTSEQIERFDRISNCLVDSECRSALDEFIRKQKNPNLLNAFKLWQLAHEADNFDEDLFLDLIDDLDEFNNNPMLTIAESHLKLGYVKQECCRLLEKILPVFVEYLNKYHRL